MYIISESIKSISPYEAGKPIKEVEREYGVLNPIKLASNENVWGPSPKVLERLKNSLNDIFLYPDGNSHYLNLAIAQFNNVSYDRVFSGAGSNEIIELLLRVLVQKGTNVVTGKYSFSIYSIVTKACGGEILFAEPCKEKSFIFPDADSIIKMCNKNTSVIIIDNPGNPTGMYLTESEMLKILDYAKKNKIVLISDEAYLEFVRASDYSSMRTYFNEYDNLVIINTFSKAYGLAGLRVGYAMCHEWLIDPVNRVRKAFNVNLLAQEAAIEALKDQEHVKKVLKLTHQALDYLKCEITKLGLECYDSQTNFLLVKVPDDSKQFFIKLLKKGVIVRPLKPYHLDNYVRISVGTNEQNLILLKALKEVL